MTRHSFQVCRTFRILIASSTLLSASLTALGQEASPETPNEAAPESDDKTPLSLDELLGIDGEKQEQEVEPESEDPESEE